MNSDTHIFISANNTFYYRLEKNLQRENMEKKQS